MSSAPERYESVRAALRYRGDGPTIKVARTPAHPVSPAALFLAGWIDCPSTIAVAWYHGSCDTRSMFSVAQRTRIRDDLVRAASEDERITAAAFVGSAAIDREDRWSDIDLALRIRPDLEPEPVARHWTERMYADHDAVHHLDVWAGPALYRVFFLSNTLQVDLSFWPSRAFAASGPTFRLLFGETNDAPMSPPPSTEALAGMGWLYALHVRSSLARGRRWQAVHMLDGLREQVVALACLRFGLPAHQGRGVDDLPPEETDLLADALVVSVEPADLHRTFASAVRLLLKEVRHIDAGLASRLASPIEELVRSSSSSLQGPENRAQG